MRALSAVTQSEKSPRTVAPVVVVDPPILAANHRTSWCSLQFGDHHYYSLSTYNSDDPCMDNTDLPSGKLIIIAMESGPFIDVCDGLPTLNGDFL